MTTRPGVEGITLAQVLFARLTQDQALADLLGTTLAGLADRVHEGTAPEDTPGPWITFTILEPQDVKVVGLTHVWSNVEAQVKVTDATESYADLVPIYQQVHALLESQTHLEGPTGGQVMTCYRVSGVQYPERDAGTQYRHLGGLYRTETQ